MPKPGIEPGLLCWEAGVLTITPPDPLQCILIYVKLQILHSKVDSVEKRLSGAGGTITLKCKDFVHLYLDMPSADDCLNVAASVEQLSNIGMSMRNVIYIFI